MLSSESVELVASAVSNQISEDMGQGILDIIQQAIVGQSASAVARGLKDACKSEQQRRIATFEGRPERSEDRVTKLSDLLTAQRASHGQANSDNCRPCIRELRMSTPGTRLNVIG